MTHCKRLTASYTFKVDGAFALMIFLHDYHFIVFCLIPSAFQLSSDLLVRVKLGVTPCTFSGINPLKGFEPHRLFFCRSLYDCGTVEVIAPIASTVEDAMLV